jgi:ethanolamine ammonia-lyase large subunit
MCVVLDVYLLQNVSFKKFSKNLRMETYLEVLDKALGRVDNEIRSNNQGSDPLAKMLGTLIEVIGINETVTVYNDNMCHVLLIKGVLHPTSEIVDYVEIPTSEQVMSHVKSTINKIILRYRDTLETWTFEQ